MCKKVFILRRTVSMPCCPLQGS